MLNSILPSYAYSQYQDDNDIQALVSAFNQVAQGYLNYLNALNLPIYTSPTISGSLLDWVAQGIYGLIRPTLPALANRNKGPLNTWEPNTIELNKIIEIGPQSYYVTTDDVFKRILTWQFYKGDGFQYSTSWLKRRIQRFMVGVNGADPGVSETYQISVAYSGPATIDIVLNSGPDFALTLAPVLQAGINAGVLSLPFEYTYSLTF